MGSYLVFNKKENNTKSISYPMATIIRDVLPNTEKEYGWTLKKKQVAKLVSFTLELLDDEEILQVYINEHKENYEFNCEDFRETLKKIHKDFVETLVEMVFQKQKYISVEWE